MKIVIIGAGISGLIAEGAVLKTFGNDIAVFDTKQKKGLDKGHKAVMRLRTTSIKDYVNCSLEKIKVHKGVWYNGKMHTEPNLLLNNIYSLKVYESLGDRSLSSLGIVERYLISDIRSASINYLRDEVIGIGSDRSLMLKSGATYQYDACISTIPMPVMLKISGMKSDVPFGYRPINISIVKLDISSTVNQTVYFAGPEPQYRATIEGDRVIIESISEMKDMEIIKSLIPFGLGKARYIKSIEQYEQKIGKIEPIDDGLRRRIMMDLTDKFNIYSFGRFATWRSLRVDQTVDDIKKIMLLIKVKNRGYYIGHDE